MNPVYNDYIKFIEDTSGEKVSETYGLKEGFYWQNNQIIKAFDTQGNLHKLFRIHTDDKLNITLSRYKIKQFEIESWESTVKRNESKIIERERESLSVITKKINSLPNHQIVVLNSQGKDSMVTVDLVKQVNKDIQIIFNNTSMDCADTYSSVKQDKSIQIINPKEGFYQWQKRLNFIPTRLSRACCTLFKEGETMNYFDVDSRLLFFLGMRAEESSSRSGYTTEWSNEKWGNRDWLGCLPIVDWTDFDVWMYLMYKGIEPNQKYKKGYSRVGCAVCCPNYTKTTWVLDKYWYPMGFKRWHDILDSDFVNNNKDIIMNCTQEEYHMWWNGGVMRKEPTEEVVEQFADRNHLDIEIARKYFGHTCESCNKKIKSKEVMAMNLKLSGRSTGKFYCKKHLMEIYGIDKIKWDEMVNGFKSDGCELF